MNEVGNQRECSGEKKTSVVKQFACVRQSHRPATVQCIGAMEEWKYDNHVEHYRTPTDFAHIFDKL